MDPDKKISFGFNKSHKKSVVIRNKPEERKVDLVECFENQSAKIKDAIQVVHEPLVIPIKECKKNLFDRIKAAKAKQDVLIKNNLKEEDTRPDSELTIEELAARELINDAKNRLSNKSSNKIFVVPIEVDKITLNGEKEPTFDDYENVPVTDYGMAMLRGMGWKEGMGIGKNPTKSAATYEPELRPKGLGLGASRMVKADIPNETVCDDDGNALILKRGTCAKIIAGSHKGNYCEVQGLDDEAGRVIVRTSLKGEILSLNEFLIVPVTKEEYSKGSKILNNARYEEYNEISDKKLQNHWKEKRETTDNHFKGPPEIISSSRQLKENQGSQDDEEQSIRSSSCNKEYLISEENKPYERKTYIYEGKNDKYDKVEKHNKATHKGKYESRSSRNRKKYSSESDSDKDIKNRRDKERKSSYRGESSKSHKDNYKKRSSKNKHRSRSSSSDNKKRDINKINKGKSGHHKHDSNERNKTYGNTRR